MNKVPPCPTCGEEFDNIFEATDHLLEENEEEFDPKLILPSGYSLMVGSLLRCIYAAADKPEEIKKITQSTYATLYAAETNPNEMKTIVEELIVQDHMSTFDEDLKELIDNEIPFEESGE
jgi:hypothetical protein